MIPLVAKSAGNQNEQVMLCNASILVFKRGISSLMPNKRYSKYLIYMKYMIG